MCAHVWKQRTILPLRSNIKSQTPSFAATTDISWNTHSWPRVAFVVGSTKTKTPLRVPKGYCRCILHDLPVRTSTRAAVYIHDITAIFKTCLLPGMCTNIQNRVMPAVAYVQCIVSEHIPDSAVDW